MSSYPEGPGDALRDDLCDSVRVTSERDLDFSALLHFRTALRRFNRWSEDQARQVGLTHAQHQLLLAIKGHPDERGPTVGEAANYLVLRHHSAVELADRVQAGGYIERRRDDVDGRVVRLTLTPRGERAIRQLAELHLSELRQLAPLLHPLITDNEPSIRG